MVSVNPHLTVIHTAPSAASKDAAAPSTAESGPIVGEFARLLEARLPVPTELATDPESGAEVLAVVTADDPEAAPSQDEQAQPPAFIAHLLDAAVVPISATPPVPVSPPVTEDAKAGKETALSSGLPASGNGATASFAATVGSLPQTAPAGADAPEAVPLPAGGGHEPRPALAPVESAPTLVSAPVVHPPAGRVEAAASTPATAQPVSVHAPVGAAGWDGEFGQRVVWLAQNNQQLAQISVSPPQLGPIEIRLHLSQDQASLSFVSPHAPVREAIEAALPRLRELFSETGLTLGQVDVSAEFHGQGDAPAGPPMASSVPVLTATATTGLGRGLPATRLVGAREGMVDVFV
jgi:flagellar hook-length control protein FliK